MTLVEIAIGSAVLALVVATALAALAVLNKNAFSSRVMSSAREVVQRNVEAAVGSPLTSAAAPPPVLAITGANGVAWDDSGGSGPVVIYTSRDATGGTLTGTLTRTVLAEANTLGADIRRVKFHLDYTLFGRPMSYEIVTLRAIDK